MLISSYGIKKQTNLEYSSSMKTMNDNQNNWTIIKTAIKDNSWVEESNCGELNQ